MSVSEISIFKCIGKLSDSTYRCLYDLEWQQNAVGNLAFSKEEVQRTSDKVDAKAKEILDKYGDISLLYASKYIDNGSVGGSSIKNVRRICSSLNCFQDGLLETERFRIWFMKPKDELDISLLRKAGRRQGIKTQASERVMFFNIVEACVAWEILQIRSLILVLEKILGPTWSDEEVLKSSE